MGERCVKPRTPCPPENHSVGTVFVLQSCIDLQTDRLLNNPWAQPPLPTDWEVRPAYPVKAVPYYLASLWDAGLKDKSVEKGRKAAVTKGKEASDPASQIPKEVREKLKRARGAKGLLQDLEEEVRRFVESWEEKERRQDMQRRMDEMPDPDSEDEEIVFVGRKGQMSDEKAGWDRQLAPDKLVFDSYVDDHGAAFG